jgi:hypothetical protein
MAAAQRTQERSQERGGGPDHIFAWFPELYDLRIALLAGQSKAELDFLSRLTIEDT